MAVATSETRIEIRQTRSTVWLKTLDPVELRHYVSTGEPLDKAGAIRLLDQLLSG